MVKPRAPIVTEVRDRVMLQLSDSFMRGLLTDQRGIGVEKCPYPRHISGFRGQVDRMVRLPVGRLQAAALVDHTRESYKLAYGHPDFRTPETGVTQPPVAILTMALLTPATRRADLRGTRD